MQNSMRYLSIVTAALGASDAFSQSQSGSTGAIEEIVVTAQFREQSLQTTPIAISAFSAENMEARSYNTIADLTNSSPNVVLKPTGSAFGPGAAIFIRGVGQSDTNFALEPGVGVYIDDVYHGTVFGSQLDLLDLDRVEILRGPQGTLAGKNSLGGAIKLFTQKPGEGTEYLHVKVGSRDRMDVRGGADLTLVEDSLYARVSGVSRKQDGYSRRFDFGCKNPGNIAGISAGAANSGNCELGRLGGTEYTAARVALRWIVHEDIETNVSFSTLSDDSEGAATKLLGLNVNPLMTPGVTDPSIFLTPNDSYDNYATYTTPAYTDADGDHPATYWDPDTHLRSWSATASIDWTPRDNLSFKSISAYQDLSGQYGTDYDVTPFGINTSVFTNAHHQFTQEFRLNGSSMSDLFDWTLGVFYYKATSYIEGSDIIAPGQVFSSVFYTNDVIPSENLSGFAHGVYHVTDKLDIIVGVRHTDDQKSYRFVRRNPFDTSEPSYTAQAAIDGVSSEYNGSSWDYRLNLSYNVTDDLMAYVQYSTGHRGGGVNPRPFVSQQAVPFFPEVLDAYEIGVKADIFDQRMRLNVSAFTNIYDDIVFNDRSPTVVDGDVVSFVNSTPTNVGEAELSGVEAELTLSLFEGLSIDTSVSLLDFEMKEIAVSEGQTIGVTIDSMAPYITDKKASLGIQYALSLGSLGTITPRFDVAYQSEFYNNIDNNPNGLVDGYTLLNARIGWLSADETWEVALAATNLADKFYYANKLTLPIGVTSGQPGAPREWSLSLQKNF